MAFADAKLALRFQHMRERAKTPRFKGARVQSRSLSRRAFFGFSARHLGKRPRAYLLIWRMTPTKAMSKRSGYSIRH